MNEAIKQLSHYDGNQLLLQECYVAETEQTIKLLLNGNVPRANHTIPAKIHKDDGKYLVQIFAKMSQQT